MAVKCLECGLEVASLVLHLRSHGMKVSYYKSKFPGAPIVDDATRARMRENAVKARAKKLQNKADREQHQIEVKHKESTAKTDLTRSYTKEMSEKASKLKEKYKGDYGLVDSPELEELVFYVITNENMQETYNVRKNAESISLEDECDLLEAIRKNSDTINSLLVTLCELKDSKEKGKDVVELHKKTMDQATDYIKKHIGEFVFRCPSCGQMIDNCGFPHPFFGGPEKYTVFSKELWGLVARGVIPIEIMAYVLRVSIEGVLATAKLRGEVIPELDLVRAEARLKDLMGEPAAGLV